MNILIKCIKHFNLVNKHRFKVFKLACKAGIPVRGLLHDLSKYSPTEFFESAKYYNGKKSPIHVCRMEKGYSNAWLHHKGRNKHHFEYWEDISKNGRYGVFPPYKYMVEAVCDKIAAGMTYVGKDWTIKEPLEYWNNIGIKSDVKLHPATIEFMNTILTQISIEGLDALNKKNLKKIYNDCLKNFN